MLFRIVQAFGGGGGMSVGAGVISDIYRLEQRGSAMGFFFAVSRRLAHARKPEELTRPSLSLSLSLSVSARAHRRASSAPRFPRYWVGSRLAMRRGASCNSLWL